MQTFKLGNFIQTRVNTATKGFNLFNDVMTAYTPEIKEYGWLAGGALRRMITGAKMDSDFDFFFRSKEKFDEFYVGIKSDKNIKIKSETKNEFNLKLVVDILAEDGSILYEGIIYQLISIQYYDKVESLLDSFDFTLCQLATDGEEFYCSDFALWDIANKRIVVNKITYPVASLRRMFKYANQGYYACNGCLTQFLLGIDPEKVSENSNKYID